MGVLAIVVDADDFLPLGVEQAHLVVGVAGRREAEKILFDAAQFLGVTTFDEALHRAVRGHDAQVANDDQQATIEHASTEADIELLGSLEMAALDIAMAIGVEIGGEQDEPGQRQEVAQEGQEVVRAHERSA